MIAINNWGDTYNKIIDDSREFSKTHEGYEEGISKLEEYIKSSLFGTPFKLMFWLNGKVDWLSMKTPENKVYSKDKSSDVDKILDSFSSYGFGLRTSAAITIWNNRCSDANKWLSVNDNPFIETFLYSILPTW
jgi:hypothetical protein